MFGKDLRAQNSTIEQRISVVTASALFSIANPYHLDIAETGTKISDSATEAEIEKNNIESFIKGDLIRLRIEAKESGRVDVYLFDKAGTRLGLTSCQVNKGPQFADINLPAGGSEFVIKVYLGDEVHQNVLRR